jgi:phosphosulfolactate phosphohydrolase-like enzyme
MLTDEQRQEAADAILRAGLSRELCPQPSKTPEAQVFANAYRASRDNIATLITDSMSGRELAARGFPGDVEIAFQQNVSTCTPVLRDGYYGMF